MHLHTYSGLTYTMEMFLVGINHARLIIDICCVCVCVREPKRLSKVQRILYLWHRQRTHLLPVSHWLVAFFI